MCIYIYKHTHTSNDYTKIGKVVIILNLSNHNLSKKLILPVTKIAEAQAINGFYGNKSRKKTYLTSTRQITQSGSKLYFGLLKKIRYKT